ncbi:hypothetical protein BU197_11195 [Streptomyces sp. CBMA291]|nr:hypothetical protein [Streptomyces sp. CBMA291]MBD0708939.1 hypothetical protein [Streptomyces sp. CBMA291]MBD0715093.1 hypothetical protein [Streptomyces sp. CBMA370]
MSSAEPTDAPAPSDPASLAGLPAGEGRVRPGRPPGPTASASAGTTPGGATRTETATEPGARDGAGEEEGTVREEEAPLPATPSASRPAAAPQLAAKNSSPLADQRIPVFTLGVGLSLMGLGIGFLGLRMRRR